MYMNGSVRKDGNVVNQTKIVERAKVRRNIVGILLESR